MACSLITLLKTMLLKLGKSSDDGRWEYQDISSPLYSGLSCGLSFTFPFFKNRITSVCANESHTECLIHIKTDGFTHPKIGT